MTTDLFTPVIGITLDLEDPGSYSKFPWYALRENYAGSIKRAGGLPFPLTHEQDLVEIFLDDIDGLVVTGGAFDVDPKLYGDDTRHDTVTLKERRTNFEMAMIRGALQKDMPILGICGGQQLLHVALGGTLIQHIPEEVENALQHEQTNPRDETSHAVKVVRDSLLFDIVGQDEIQVNSAHHQAAKEISGSIKVTGTAPDGVIEAIEAPGMTFCLGVQWHPEFEITDADERIIAAFVEASRAYADTRAADWSELND